MIGILAAIALQTLPANAATAFAPPRFIESKISFDRELISYEIEDVDGDKLADLLAVVEEKAGRRLSFHRQRDDQKFAREPDWALLVPAEVVAFALLDVRPEPGREILLFTPTGVLSVSITKPGLAANARVEIRQDVFPEISESDRLQLWPWLLDLDCDGDDDLVLPEVGKLAWFVVEEGADGARHMVRRGEVPSRFTNLEKPEMPRQFALDDDDSGDFDVRALRLFQSADSTNSTLPRLARPPLLDRRRNWQMPRLGFWNADKRPDALIVEKGDLFVRTQHDDGSFSDERRLEQPELVKDKERSYELVDFEGDGKSELVRITRDEDGLEKEFELVVTAIRDDDTLDESARTVLLFQASDAEFEFRDADGDGYQDLVLETTQLPSGIASIASIKVDVALEVYRGHADGTLSRRPDARFARTFTPDKLARLSEAEIFHLSGDYDGDAMEDIVLMDDEGRLRIHRLVRDGGELEFSDEPFIPPYLPPEPVLSCWAYKLTDDGVTDLCLRFEKSVILLVSRPEGGE